VISLAQAAINYAPHVAKRLRSPTTFDADEERDFIVLLCAMERAVLGTERATIGCIRATAELTRDKRLKLIRGAVESKQT